MITRNLLAATAAASLAIVPVAAQAGTRASADGIANVPVSTGVAARKAKGVASENRDGPGIGIVGAILGVGILGGFVALATTDGDNDSDIRSPGS